LLYIMFLAGLEIDLDMVESHKLEAIGFGVLTFALSLVPAVAVGLLIGYGWIGALLVGAALSSHTLLAYPILERLQILRRRPVVAAIGGTMLTDTFALAMLVIVLQQAGGDDQAAAWYVPLLLLALLAGVSLLVLPRLARWLFTTVETGRAEKALAVLVVLLTLSALADLIGTEDILGAFLAGVCLNRPLRAHRDLLEHIRFAGHMLFVPFFFVETGMRLKLEVLTGGEGVWLIAGMLIAAVVIGKSSAAWLTGAWFGYRGAERVVIASLAIPQAAATLAVAVKARGMGLVDETMIDAIIVVIFVTCLAGPLVTRAAGRRMETARSEGR
jgi:Kef-type K+ transport system membrane component KefB